MNRDNGNKTMNSAKKRENKSETPAFNARRFLAGMWDVDDNGRKAYLIVGGGDVTNRVIGSAETQREKNKVIIVRAVEGEPCTVLKCRRKYLDALLSAHTKPMLYNLLLQKFSEVDLRNFYYDLWMYNHNEQVKRANEYEVNVRNYCRKRGLSYDSGIRKFAKGMTVRESSQVYGCL